MIEIHKIEAKNYAQYRYMKFQTTTGSNSVLVCRVDDKNERLFYCSNLSDDISENDMIKIILEYIHRVSFDEYEQQERLLISGKINGKNYKIQSDGISYI